MPVVKQCLSCNKPLTGKRSHAVTCGSTCRGIQWRANKEPVVQVSLTLSVPLYKRIKAEADAKELSISYWLISQALSIAS